jgi:hypothetical protein
MEGSMERLNGEAEILIFYCAIKMMAKSTRLNWEAIVEEIGEKPPRSSLYYNGRPLLYPTDIQEAIVRRKQELSLAMYDNMAAVNEVRSQLDQQFGYLISGSFQQILLGTSIENVKKKAKTTRDGVIKEYENTLANLEKSLEDKLMEFRRVEEKQQKLLEIQTFIRTLGTAGSHQ